MFSQWNHYVKDLSVVRRVAFATRFYPQCMPAYWDKCISFGVRGKEARCELSPDNVKVLVENMKVMDKGMFASDDELVQEICPCSDELQLGVVLVSPRDTCLVCGGKLYIRAQRSSSVVIYDDRFGTMAATHYVKYCRRQSCSLQQYYGFYTQGSVGEVHYNDDWHTLPYFMSSRETVITMDFLRRFDKEILIGQISYKQRADIYNEVHGYSSGQYSRSRGRSFLDRKKSDRRRLECAHFKYAVLQVAGWYPRSFSQPISFYPDIKETLVNVTPGYQKAFHTFYSDHQCEAKGCGTVLVIDGNLKNNREVCAAVDAGFVEYPGLPGKVKTGCMETPEQQSKYCSDHKPRRLISSDDRADGRVIEMILAKKETRQTVHYQVLWLGREDCFVTWEAAESLPKTIIEEYERGIRPTVTDCTTEISGVSHTLKVIHSNQHTSSTRPVIKENEGAFVQEHDDYKLECNTEKDKMTLHHRTAGILAGIWPCGIITIVHELFRSEGKAQVYGCLHSYFFDNPSTKQIEILCYDDGCHLRKYATNANRSQLTETTKQLANLNIVIDKLHFSGHVDRWCQEHCNPHNISDLENVDTEICEQTFSWLSRYSRITRHMDRAHFLFYILYLSDLHNRRRKSLS